MLPFLFGLAFAGLPEDLADAADTDLPTKTREEAWGRLVKGGTARDLVRLAELPDTPKNQRWVAIRALGPIPGDEARDAILRYLEAKDASTRMAALGALGDRGDRALSGRVAAALSDKALLVRAAAAEALAKLGDPSTLGDLERALKDPTNSYRGTSMWVRRRFVETMAAIGTDAAVPYLARALDDADADVSAAAVHGLEKVAGFSYAEGRTPEEEREAWRRWAGR
ncbi:MAG: HEAT repeat domain-containing protein [Myxococcota bacterium]